MAHAVWPAELPQHFLRDGYSTSRPDGRERVPSDKGPAGMRLSFSSAIQPVQGRIALEPAQLPRFWRFYRDDIKRGTKPFVIRDQVLDGSPLLDANFQPVLTSSVEPALVSAKWLVQFVDPPREERSGRRWVISMSLEILPI